MQLQRRLSVVPEPLLDATHQLVVSWAAKAASVHTLIWHLAQIGQLKQAQERTREPDGDEVSGWPHRYRYGDYLQSSYLERSRAACAPSWTLVKVVRDPVKRCVSSYRAMLRHKPDTAERMSGVLGRTVTREAGYSFEEFVTFLERIDLRTCDIHYALQTHPVDAVDFARVFLINADTESLSDALHRLEARLGLDHVPEQEAWIAAKARRHAVQAPHPPAEAWRVRWNMEDAAASEWAGSSLIADPTLRRRIEAVYREDYETLDRLRRRAEPL